MDVAAATPQDIESAAMRVAPHLRATPVLALPAGELCDVPVWLKLEQLQLGGSFKTRAAFNALLERPLPAAGVIAASGGNHGIAIGLAAQKLGVAAEIVVPDSVPAQKREALAATGARVIVAGQRYAEALEAMQERAAQTGATVIPAYDTPTIVAGQGTLAREFESQVSGLDTVFVTVGGGGLLGGCLTWFGSRVETVAVEPRLAPTLHAALAVDRPVDVSVGGVASDALSARKIGQMAFQLAQRGLKECVLVEDADILAAQRLLWERLRLVVEPAGAVAVAALTSGRYRPRAGEKIGIILCRGNADLSSLLQSEAGRAAA